MAAPPSAFAGPSSPLHLYRHLLREASYLPTAFRSNIVSIIRGRFHSNKTSDGQEKDRKRLSRARRALRIIAAANHGIQHDMVMVMSWGFGRSGYRRRKLMADFVRPQVSQVPKEPKEVPANSKSLEGIIAAVVESKAAKDSDVAKALKSAEDSEPSGGSPKVPLTEDDPLNGLSKNHAYAPYARWDQDKLLQFIKSQSTQEKIVQRLTSWPFKDMGKHPNVLVPELNIWGKPPNEKVKRKKQATWWKQNSSKILPPLEPAEWELLKRLADGGEAGEEWKIPERRTPAKAEDGSTDWNWESHATQPAAMAERAFSPHHERRTIGEGLGPYNRHSRKQSLSPRWYRRAYQRLWTTTSRAEQNPETKQFTFTWGSVGAAKIPRPTKTQMSVFEGVDGKGQPLTTESKT